MEVLVAYDIATPDREGERRLAKVASICERYGVRAQYSLFECRVSAAGLEKLKGELADVIKMDYDAIDIYRFDRPISDVRSSIGRPRLERPGGSWIF
jgi:CRISPR-associated protein Cas2